MKCRIKHQLKTEINHAFKAKWIFFKQDQINLNTMHPKAKLLPEDEAFVDNHEHINIIHNMISRFEKAKMRIEETYKAVLSRGM